MPKKKSSPPFEPNDLLISLTVPLELQSTIRVMDLGKLRFFESSPDGETKRVSAPDANDVFIRPREGTPERKAMGRLINLLAAEVERGPTTGIAYAQAEKFLLGKGFDKIFIENVIRASVGVGTLKATPRAKNDIYLSLSRAARQHERRRTFSLSFATELDSQSQQLGRLIEHGSTVGSEREELLRALLERHVPGRFHVASGFIDGFSPQFDILIYDRIDFAPVFRAGNLVVVPPEAVHAVIEVKSTLNATNIADALEHLDVLTFVSMGRPPIFRGIFAFDGVGPRPIAKAIRHHHRLIDMTAIDDDAASNPIVNIDQMVNAVCVLGKSIVQTGFAKLTGAAEFEYMPITTSLDSDAGHASQAGAFFDLLDRFLRYPYEGPFERASLLNVVRDDILIADVTPLYPSEEWVAPIVTMGEDELLKDRIEAYDEWLMGRSWRRPRPV